MKKVVISVFLINLFILVSCLPKDDYVIPLSSFDVKPTDKAAVVKLSQVNDKWHITVDGKDFYIKGVAANNFYERAIDYGANVVRTYGLNDSTQQILDDAAKNGLYVNFGLYVKRERDGFDYNNAEKVKEQFDEMKAIVKRFKDHPALLIWSIGNEAESAYSNLKLWDAIQDIAKMIHEIDPNHPTTTALASSNVDNIKSIIAKAPDIDILSINTYAPNLPGVLANLTTAGWVKPYMITEFGPRGTWQMGPEPTRILPWGGLVEQTSTEKAADYLNAYQNNIISNKDKGCIGSFVFLWGYQKHGEVLNWYGLFDKQGCTYAAVDEMQFVWTGKYPANKAPTIASRKDMKMNGKIAEDAIIVSIGSNNSASVAASDPDNDPLTYNWLIIEEGGASTDGSLPSGIDGLIQDSTKSSITFTAPNKAGKYRLYVFVKDDNNKKVASAAIPFLVQ
ncbi:MAG: glycoside hydrolase family 2 TIM barrel-domain containing protein [Paludibacteraceae bacterium]